MLQSLNILMISPECVPFAKTGGLADVVGALPKALQALGHNVVVVMPKYASIDTTAHGASLHLRSMGVWMGDSQEWCAIHEASLAGGVPVYFVEYNLYFDRLGLYHDEQLNDYPDNPRRFGFLTRAALQLCRDTGFRPENIEMMALTLCVTSTLSIA